MNNNSLNKIKSKILKVYKILDDLILKSFNKNELSVESDNNIYQILKDKKGELESLKSEVDEKTIFGIVLCFKFFKSISKFLLYFFKFF